MLQNMMYNPIMGMQQMRGNNMPQPMPATNQQGLSQKGAGMLRPQQQISYPGGTPGFYDNQGGITSIGQIGQDPRIPSMGNENPVPFDPRQMPAAPIIQEPIRPIGPTLGGQLPGYNPRGYGGRPPAPVLGGRDFLPNPGFAGSGMKQPMPVNDGPGSMGRPVAPILGGNDFLPKPGFNVAPVGTPQPDFDLEALKGIPNQTNFPMPIQGGRPPAPILGGNDFLPKPSFGMPQPIQPPQVGGPVQPPSLPGMRPMPIQPPQRPGFGRPPQFGGGFMPQPPMFGGGFGGGFRPQPPMFGGGGYGGGFGGGFGRPPMFGGGGFGRPPMFGGGGFGGGFGRPPMFGGGGGFIRPPMYGGGFGGGFGRGFGGGGRFGGGGGRFGGGGGRFGGGMGGNPFGGRFGGGRGGFGGRRNPFQGGGLGSMLPRMGGGNFRGGRRDQPFRDMPRTQGPESMMFGRFAR